MIKKGIRFLLHLAVVVFLTLTTQIGGIIYIISVVAVKRKKTSYRLKRVGLFLVFYLISNLVVIPNIAPLFGREKIKQSKYIKANTFFTNLMNRNYVRPELNTSLQNIARRFNQKHNGLQIVYLDANFPFINKFPLLPHLSHNDGKKMDISFVYRNNERELTNKKPSVSGYGVFSPPLSGEFNQIKVCMNKGKWQYDFTKYFTFGTINSQLVLSEIATKNLIIAILEEPSTGKLFVEPHLKSRLALTNNRIRYHGCQAVRHDDHIHFQLK